MKFRRATTRLHPVLLIFFLCSWVSTSTSSFAFDHDTAADCADRVKNCEKDKTTFFACPITCAKYLQPENESQRSSSGLLNDEAFYELQATDVNGKNINFENYEGYVTVIAALPPKQQGVSQWYYEMLEHLHEVYPYTMEILVVPSDNKRLKIQTVRDPKVSILPKPYAGMLDLLKGALHGTLNDEKKATLYLIGADGNTVEAFVSTNMQDFQRYLRFHFEKDLRKSEF